MKTPTGSITENLNYIDRMEKLTANKMTVVGKTLDAHRLCTEGFLKQDIALLNQAKNYLKGLEELANELDDKIITMVGLFDPEATDLREMIALLKIVNELVRIGNCTKSCANRAIWLIEEKYDYDGLQKNLTILFSITYTALKIVCDALMDEKFSDHTQIFSKVKIEESKTDDICGLIQKEIYDRNSGNELSKKALAVLEITKKLERSADHTENIAHLLEYIKLGGKIKTY